MKKLTGLLQWIDTRILKILVIGFIFLIPLYPKLPFMGVNYTYVAIRIEDLYIGLTSIIFAIQFLRRKVTVPIKFAVLIGLFWLAIFGSLAWGLTLGDTLDYPQLAFLHAFRRVEYMIIFFIAYTTVKTRKDVTLYVNLILSVLAIVCVYGIGQKFLGWPAVQTMNPEYAKGYLLVLDAYARVSSTFAGHYDFAAYLIFLMPIVIGYYLWTDKKMYFILFVLALAVLILTASRASYLSYIGAMGLFLLYVRKFKVLLAVIIVTAILTPLSDNLTSRLTRTFQQTKIFVDPVTGEVIVPRESRHDILPVGDFGTNIAPGTAVRDTGKVDAKTQQLAKNELRKTIVEEANQSGQVLTEEQINALVESAFGKQIPVTKYLLDISLSTRFQVEWPRAIAAFLKNPALGTGPSSLGEATDGDYFRWLGETGLTGTLLFLGIIFEIMRTIWIKMKRVTKKISYLFYGFLFGTIGLLANASYIDVFEASKVAYTFWLVSGIFIGAITVFASEKKDTHSLKMQE